MTGAPKGSSGSPTEPAGHTLVSGTPVSQSRWAGQAHTPQQRSPFEDNQRPFRRVPRCNDVARSCPLQTSASTAQARRRAVMRVVGAGEHEPILAPGPVGIRVPRRCGGLCGSDTNGSMRPSDARARIASGRDSGPADHAIFMTTARTGNQWRAQRDGRPSTRDGRRASILNADAREQAHAVGGGERRRGGHQRHHRLGDCESASGIEVRGARCVVAQHPRRGGTDVRSLLSTSR